MFASTVRFWGRSRDLPGRMQPHIVPGGHSEGETPGPIPNPEVKPFSADGTAWETAWESRTPPDIFPLRAVTARRGPSALCDADSGRLAAVGPAVGAGMASGRVLL